MVEHTLCKFVSYLADKKLKHRTIKTYLSGVRYLQIRSGYADPFHGSHLPHLEYTMRGIKRVQARDPGEARGRLPITPAIMRAIRGAWAPTTSLRDTKMLWAACCLAFFGFLRVGEMTMPDDHSYDASTHLSFADVAVDDPINPSFVKVSIKQSKTDPFRKGVDLYLGKTGTDLCPVGALLSYLVARGSESGPLLVFADTRVLTRKRFVDAVKAALTAAGIEQKNYNGHSFRIGAATTAAAKGIEDSIIKTLGRWESVAYQQYVRIPRTQLTQYAKVLVSAQ